MYNLVRLLLTHWQDLVQVRVPRFTVSASDRHFQTISNIITNLILFSDAAHKTRLEKLEALLFAYDFTDLRSAANVVSDLQSRLRNALETRRDAENHALSASSDAKLNVLKLKAHIFLLTEDLNLIFDAIKLAQDRADERSDQKSALLLLASSSEISWKMVPFGMGIGRRWRPRGYQTALRRHQFLIETSGLRADFFPKNYDSASEILETANDKLSEGCIPECFVGH